MATVQRTLSELYDMVPFETRQELGAARVQAENIKKSGRLFQLIMIGSYTDDDGINRERIMGRGSHLIVAANLAAAGNEQMPAYVDCSHEYYTSRDAFEEADFKMKTIEHDRPLSVIEEVFAAFTFGLLFAHQNRSLPNHQLMTMFKQKLGPMWTPQKCSSYFGKGHLACRAMLNDGFSRQFFTSLHTNAVEELNDLIGRTKNLKTESKVYTRLNLQVLNNLSPQEQASVLELMRSKHSNKLTKTDLKNHIEALRQPHQQQQQPQQPQQQPQQPQQQPQHQHQLPQHQWQQPQQQRQPRDRVPPPPGRNKRIRIAPFRTSSEDSGSSSDDSDSTSSAAVNQAFESLDTVPQECNLCQRDAKDRTPVTLKSCPCKFIYCKECLKQWANAGGRRCPEATCEQEFEVKRDVFELPLWQE